MFVVDPSGSVVARSEARQCSCPVCSDPPERFEGDISARIEVRLGDETIGAVRSCKAVSGAAAALDCLAKALSMKAMDQVDLDSLSEELLSKYEEINLVYDISGAIASVFDERRIAERVLERVMQAIEAERGVAIVANKETGGFELTAAVGLPEDAPKRWEGLFEKKVCQEIVKAGKAKVVDAPEDSTSGEDVVMTPPLVCSPLIAGERVMGAVALASRRNGGNFRSGDLKLLSAIASATGIAIQNARLVEEAKEQERLRRELEIAASIQSSLLPDAPPKVAGTEIVARNIAAERVGGDYYGFFEGEHGRVSLVIADVSGHSIAAALMAATLRSVIRAATAQGGGPSEVVGRINRMMYPDLENAEMLVSMFYAEYDPGSASFGFANAGHNRPILCRGGRCKQVKVPGLLLGVLSDRKFPQESLSLQAGDVVLFYTDGLVEAENEAHEPYGEDRLMAVVAETASLPLDRLLDACLKDARRHAGTESLYDDVTMIAIRRE
ncbi:MAG: SpoIIE family protein phosphatase [Planctomycetes bacterium]|nr:SpoIIE family protein phosphatase [Planctomycetota bacterium]